MSFTVNLRAEITKADSHTTQVWLFSNILFYTLLRVWWRKCKTTPPYQITDALRPMCLVHVMEKALGSSPGVVCTPFYLRCWETNSEQARPASPRKEHLLWTAALAALCQGLLAAAAQSLQRGQGSPGSFLSHGSWWVSEFPGWLSVNPSILHLTELFGGNVHERLSHLLHLSLTMAGGSGPAHVEMEGTSLLSDGNFLFQNGCTLFFPLSALLCWGRVNWLIRTLLPSPSLWSLTFFKSAKPKERSLISEMTNHRGAEIFHSLPMADISNQSQHFNTQPAASSASLAT